MVDTFLGKLQRITYKQPKQMYGLEALHLLNKAIDNGINLRGGKDSLGFLFIYELLTGMSKTRFVFPFASPSRHTTCSFAPLDIIFIPSFARNRSSTSLNPPF